MQKMRMDREIFVVVHTARAVPYNSNGFCDKNKDEVSRCIIECILGTKNTYISDIYYMKVRPGDTLTDYFGKKKKKTEGYLGYKFRNQVTELMTTLRACQCTFMRCLKPNEKKSDKVWNSSLVCDQIRYLGLLDSIKIRKDSYPFRYVFKDFCGKFLELEPALSHFMPEQLEAEGHPYKDVSQSIIRKVLSEWGDDQVLVGKTKVFMKIECYEFLLEAYKKACQAKISAIKGNFF